MMNKLTAKQLLMINRKLTGNKQEVSDAILREVEEISNIPYEQDERFFYKYKNTVAKAAKLGCSIAFIKPFEEKNNQTAVIALLALLELNKVKLSEYVNELGTLVPILERDDFDGAYGWIEKHRDRDQGESIE